MLGLQFMCRHRELLQCAGSPGGRGRVGSKAGMPVGPGPGRLPTAGRPGEVLTHLPGEARGDLLPVTTGTGK